MIVYAAQRRIPPSQNPLRQDLFFLAMQWAVLQEAT